MPNKKKYKKRTGYREKFLILATAFWAIYPFITRILVKKVPKEEEIFFATSQGMIADIMLFCKEMALAGFVIIALLYFLGERIFPDKVEKLNRERFKRLKFPLIFMGIYLLFSVLSFALSKYKETALFGVNSEYEGLIAIVCYAGVFLFGLYYLNPKEKNDRTITSEDILVFGIAAMCLLAGILSLVEVFVKPILEFGFVQDLISSEENRELAHSIKNENFIGQICLSFHNPGFFGGFCALFIPIDFVIALKGKKVLKIMAVIGTGLLLFGLMWSNSRVAYAATALSMVICIVILLICNRKAHKKNLIVTFMSVVIIAVVPAVLSKTVVDFSKPENTMENGDTENTGIFRLSKATLENGELYLYSGDKLLKVSLDTKAFNECQKSDKTDYSECLVFFDGENILEERVPVTLKATNIREAKQGFGLTAPGYEAVRFTTEKAFVIFDLGYSGTVEFYMTSVGLKIFGQGSKLLEEIPQPKVTGLEKIYSFATGRGYIWAQSLPILADSILVGGGNGTFAFRFNQNEIVGLLNTHGSCKYVIDRPHNWYLQIACSDGIIALAAVAALFLYYLINYCLDLKKIKKNGKGIMTESGIFEAGLFAGLAGFMLCGFINDSCVTVNPLFWLMLGRAVAGLSKVRTVTND